MTDLRQQITEALDKAERVARAATPGPWRYNPHKQWLAVDDPQRRRILAALGMRGEEFVGAGPLDATIGVAGTGPADDPQSMADAAFIARCDPAREMRLIERDRALLADITPGGEGHWLATRILEGMSAFWLDNPEGS